MPFKPGIVGGHCIGVDPYYLTYQSEKLGYSPEIIISGRRLNDNMSKYIAQRVIKLMISNSIIVEDSKVLILGYSFKENCPDIRNSKVVDIIDELKDYNTCVDIYDPWVQEDEEVNKSSKVSFIQEINKIYDAVILAVAHNEFYDLNINAMTFPESIIFDIKSYLPPIKDRKIHKL
tara:strand:- start:39 stop:566 length:528 start_codon:yes stop_codon:yes gene_type:complete